MSRRILSALLLFLSAMLALLPLQGADFLKFQPADFIPGKGVSRVSFPGGSYDYREFAIDFTMPANNGNFEIQIGGRAAAGTITIDDVQLKK